MDRDQLFHATVRRRRHDDRAAGVGKRAFAAGINQSASRSKNCAANGSPMLVVSLF
jgi:hypothetical protein